MWDMTCSRVRHDSFTCETWLVHVWDMTRSRVRHDSFINETWIVHMTSQSEKRHTSTLLRRPNHMWDMTHSYERQRHDSFINVTRLNHMRDRDTTHSYMWHDSFICDTETRLIHICDMTHSQERRGFFKWLFSMREEVLLLRILLRRLIDSFIHTKHSRSTTHSYETWLIHVRDTVSIICETRLGHVQVSFAKQTLFYRALLQKRPVILRERRSIHSLGRRLINTRHDSFTWETRLIHMRDKSCTYERRSASIFFFLMIHS